MVEGSFENIENKVSKTKSSEESRNLATTAFEGVTTTSRAKSNQTEVVFTALPTDQQGKGDRGVQSKTLKDGDEIPFSQLLKEYQTPFIDAYNKSKAAKDGDPDKSKVLESVIDRMKECPWFDQIKVRFDSKKMNSDYDPTISTISLNPSDSFPKQIEMFVHEGHHSTNARLHKLYLGDKPVDKKTYADLMSNIEVGAFEKEIQAHQEITGKMPQAGIVSYKYVGKDGQKSEMDLAKLYAEKGREGLASFLLDDAKTVMNIDQRRGLHTYREYYESAYKSYVQNYEANRTGIQNWIKTTPGLAEKLKEKDF